MRERTMAGGKERGREKRREDEAQADLKERRRKERRESQVFEFPEEAPVPVLALLSPVVLKAGPSSRRVGMPSMTDDLMTMNWSSMKSIRGPNVRLGLHEAEPWKLVWKSCLGT